jgi:hypothetical protein
MLFRPMNIGISDIYLDYIPAERNLQIILRLALADKVAYAGVNKGYAARGVGSNSRKACRTRRRYGPGLPGTGDHLRDISIPNLI